MERIEQINEVIIDGSQEIDTLPERVKSLLYYFITDEGMSWQIGESLKTEEQSTVNMRSVLGSELNDVELIAIEAMCARALKDYLVEETNESLETLDLDYEKFKILMQKAFKKMFTGT